MISFSIPVDLFAGDVTLTWDPPTTNADGTPLTDLEGYKVYYGTASNSYSNNTDAGNVTDYTVTGLTDGLTYYFAVTAYDTSGNESSYSNEISNTTGTAPPPPPAPEITVTDSASPFDDLLIPFGSVMEGSRSDRTVTVRNDGNADIIIGTASQANPLGAPFSIISDNCSGQTVAPSASCTLTVRFSPAGAGLFNDSFDIPSNDQDENPVTISLSGTGIANNPPAADISGQLAHAEGQAVTLDGSGSADPDGSITLYEWDIDNDGTYDYSSQSPTVTHTYVQQNTYTIRLRVTDNLGATGEATAAAVISDTSPSAGFTASETGGTAPLTISFSDSSTGYDQPLTYKWDFDNDGITDSTVQNPTYTYDVSGTYTVKLTVTDSDGSTNTLSRMDYVSVTAAVNNPPVANISGPSEGVEGQAVTIDGSGSTDADGSIALYEWDIDNDGTYDYSSQSPTVTHTYVQHNTYTIRLRVTDDLGATGEATAAAVISDTSPSAGFTASETGGNAPFTISFTDNSAGYDMPLTYKWDFDNDGITDATVQNPTYTYDVSGTYTVKLTVTDSDGSTNTLTRTDYITAAADEKTLSCTDSGNIICLERADGGNDSDNLDMGMPKADLSYEFKAILKDSSGSAPQYIKLFMSQRSNPGAGDFYSYDMGCIGDYSSGALCTYTTRLGPAAFHKFYLESKTSDGTILRYPESGYITGPQIALLAEYNIVGLPRDIGNELLDGNAAFGTGFAYRWDTDLEYYKGITAGEPVIPGEGYFVYKNTDTLPELAGYGDIIDAEFTYMLRTGWNMVSDPYGGNVRLSDISVQKGTNAPVTWAEAASYGWLTNAVYYYNGTDWGNTYSFAAGQNAELVPWLGCWINLNMADDTYYLVIPRP